MAVFSLLSPQRMSDQVPKFGSVTVFSKVQLFIDKAELLPVVRGQMQAGARDSCEPLLGD